MQKIALKHRIGKKPIYRYWLFFQALLMLAIPLQAAQTSASLPIPPIEQPKIGSQEVVDTGKALFYSTLLAKTNDLSCNSCHMLNRAGTDGQKTYIGAKGKVGKLNTPTIYNSSLNFRFGWNGRFKSLEEMILDHLTREDMFNQSLETAKARLEMEQTFFALFDEAFEDGIQEKNILTALTTFIRTLVTPSPFDAYLKGDLAALTSEQIEGYTLFQSYGCITCHQGRNAGGNIYQKIGIYLPYFSEETASIEQNLGKYHYTQKEMDKFVFRVPSLRNVALTAPYFHDGSVDNLEDVLNIMGKHPIGKPLFKPHKKKIIAFLNALNGTTIDPEQPSEP